MFSVPENVNVKGPGVDVRFRDELKGVTNSIVGTKLQILLTK